MVDLASWENFVKVKLIQETTGQRGLEPFVNEISAWDIEKKSQQVNKS